MADWTGVRAMVKAGDLAEARRVIEHWRAGVLKLHLGGEDVSEFESDLRRAEWFLRDIGRREWRRGYMREYMRKWRAKERRDG